MRTATRLLALSPLLVLGSCASVAEPARTDGAMIASAPGTTSAPIEASYRGEADGGEGLPPLAGDELADLEPEGPKEFPMSAEELSIWSDPGFQRRFIESYVAATDVEPAVTTLEREQMQQILDAVSKDRRDKAVRLLEKYGTPTSSAVFDFTLASLYLEEERPEEAVRHYADAVEKYPNFRRAWRNQGLAYVKLNRFDDARDSFTRVIELGGGDALTYGLLGFAYTNTGNPLSAESAYRLATLLDPKTLDWKLHLAQSLFQQERFADAAALCGTLIAENPDTADYWLLQANAYIGLGRPLDAAENFEMVDGLGASTAESLNMLGDIYVNEKLFDSAVSCYVRAMHLDREGGRDRAIRAAKALTAQGAHDQTARLVEAIESLSEDSLDLEARKDLLRLRARLAVARGAGDEEVAVLEDLVALDPLDGDAYILLGQHAARTGDPEQAIFYYERAESLEGFEARAKLRHAQVLVGLERYAEALPLLRRAQTLDPRENVQDYLDQVERIAQSR